jgi:hypothetical protein
VRVERRRLAEVADLEDAALLLSFGGERGAGEQYEGRHGERPVFANQAG